ncbi:hypothetical protein KR018_008494, partial [Drosophila ironensis]
MTHLVRACDASMRKGSNRSRQQPVYWWNQDIANARRECFRSRRAFQRSLRRGRTQTATSLHNEFMGKRRALRDLIKHNKKRLFLELCDKADTDPWGMA